MPYITPQELPEGDDCRPLSIPADSEWLALFGGALTELTKSWNWEYSGGLTVEETVDKMNEIIDGWYADACGGCELPGGIKIIRIGAGGHLEELGDDGTWGEPEGDYIIPPPDARTGGTEEDQICLAAKNAVNVLEQLYETLSEAWASHLSEAEAGTEFIIAAGAIIGFEFAPITLAIVAFLEVAFAALYTALEYLGADLWDENFTKQLVCMLQGCANNDAGVVTFDWDCLMGQLNSLTDSFGLSEIQLRLYLQVSYILYFIGGIDGLNLAARTSEITDDFCDCDPGWCWDANEATNLDEWTAGASGGGTYDSGLGQWQGTAVGTGGYGTIYAVDREWDFGVSTIVSSIAVRFGCSYNDGGRPTIILTLGGTQVGRVDSPYTTGAVQTDQTFEAVFADITCDKVRVYMASGIGCSVDEIVMRGLGDNPIGDDNC